jgi:3-oxoacyl-[acyl-carrier protein] reductase
VLDADRSPRYPDLAGKVVLVTGGSKGIGAATVLALAANGARVAVGGRDEAALASVVAGAVEAGGEAVAVPGSVVEWDEVESVRAAVEARLGPIDVLVAFAGGFGPRTAIQDTGEREWREVVDSNLTSTFLSIKSVLPGMIERRGGAIVTMASCAARHLDVPLTASYAAAKAGIVQLTRHVALEVGEHGIRANCVAPGTTSSERVLRNLDEQGKALMAGRSVFGRIATPEETAMAALFLASDAASGYLTGVTIDISGGRVML